jgi:hypothetical protein
MKLIGVPVFTMIATIWLGVVQAEAQAPCREYLRLRNTATEAWKEAMRAPRSERSIRSRLLSRGGDARIRK